MKTNFKNWAIVFAALGSTLIIAPNARAGCGGSFPKPGASLFPMNDGQIRLLPAAFEMTSEEDQHSAWKPTIVGFWHVTFTAKTMNEAIIKDMVIDSALVVWHSDGTEIMNSGRPPQDGNFCMGVWKQTGERTYRLNHFAWGGNEYNPPAPDGFVGDPAGPVHYQENVTVRADGNHYTGNFVLDAFGTSGVVNTTFTGVINATRITLGTTAHDLL